MICKNCKNEFRENEMFGNGKLYCKHCFEKKSNYIKGRKHKLLLLQLFPLDLKILKTKMLIQEAIYRYGNKVYVSYSGGKDSTVISHIARQIKPDILHIFANTTCEYPETIKHVLWEKNSNDMNLSIVNPHDKYNVPWNFKRVVENEGYPLFSKAVANAIRTYLGMECSIIGIIAEESRQRELDWVNYGCNVFDTKKENQCRPISFWTEHDIYEYINQFNVRISELYNMGYMRNGCMYCGFGIEHDTVDGKNRFERLAETHPKCYKYMVDNFSKIFDECGIRY